MSIPVEIEPRRKPGKVPTVAANVIIIALTSAVAAGAVATIVQCVRWVLGG